MTYKVKRYKPKTLGYVDRHGKYHGPWMVTGSRRWKPIHNISKARAKEIANARNRLAKKKK